MRALSEVVKGWDTPEVRNAADAIPDAWAHFLSQYTWQWFGTFTFRDEVHPERADKSFRFWVSTINIRLAGRNWHRRPKKCVQWVRGLEWQKRGVIHYHALFFHPLGLDNLLLKRDWEQAWAMQLAGTKVNPRPDELKGIARIETPRTIQQVSEYLTKYAMKDGEIDVSWNLPTRGRVPFRLLADR